MTPTVNAFLVTIILSPSLAASPIVSSSVERSDKDLGFFPFELALHENLSTNNISEQPLLNVLSLGLISHHAGALYGLGLSLGCSHIDNDMIGVQIALAYNVVEASVFGLQFSLLHNDVVGSVYGLQLSGLINRSKDSLLGVQLAGLSSSALQRVYGVQISGLINVAGSSIYGAQIAALVNISREKLFGSQVALVNVSHALNGVQLGLLNKAQFSNGIQLGLINFAQHAQGAQIGLVNMRQRGDALPFGIINLSDDGVRDLALAIDDAGFTQLRVLLGQRHLFSSLALALQARHDGMRLHPTLGIGTRRRLRDHVDFELEASSGPLRESSSGHWSLLLQSHAHSTIVWHCLSTVAVNIGVGGHALFGFDPIPAQHSAIPLTWTVSTEPVLALWPAAQLGMRYAF